VAALFGDVFVLCLLITLNSVPFVWCSCSSVFASFRHRHRHHPLLCIQPFAEEGHPLHAYFPERQWAIAIPASLLVLLVAVATSFIALVSIKKARKKAAAKKGN